MLLLGLTGSIATGKSTVSTLLSSPPYSLPIIDADLLARRVVLPGTPGYLAILSHFLPTTPDLLLPTSAPECGGFDAGKDGKGRPIDRAVLGRRVFKEGGEKERKVLEGIVHPRVRRELFKELLLAYLKGNWAVILDIPLLFESGWERLCGCILVVAVKEPSIQMQRLRARDPHLTPQDAEDRVRAQTDVREKAERAKARGEGWGVVVWNDQGKEELEEEVRRVMQKVRRGSPRWRGWLCLLFPPVGAVAALRAWLWGWWCQRRWKEGRAREKAKL